MVRRLMAHGPADQRPVLAGDPAVGSGACPAACRLRAAAHLFLAAAAAAPKARGSLPAVEAAERDAAAVRQPAGVAVSAAAAEQAPLEAAVGSGAAAERQPEEAAERAAVAVPQPAEEAAALSDVVVVPQPEEAAVSDAVAVLQPEEAAVSDAVAVLQPEEAAVLDAAVLQPVAQGAPAAFRASAAGLSFPSLFPFPGLSAPGLVVLRPAACFARVRQSLRIAWRS
jgi:hypothetical protein